MINRHESNMNFIFDDSYYYSIEEDGFYKKVTSKYGAKVCDFITYKNENLLFIEAKNSAPQSKDELHAFANEVSQKFIDSIFIYIGVVYDRDNTPSNIITSQMNNRKLLESHIKLILVINGLPKKALQDIQNIFEKVIKKFKYIFSISSILILNNEQAKSKGMIV